MSEREREREQLPTRPARETKNKKKPRHGKMERRRAIGSNKKGDTPESEENKRTRMKIYLLVIVMG